MLDFPLAQLEHLGPYQIVGHLSFVLAAPSFLLRDILLLRLVAVVASLCNIAFAFGGLPTTNWIVIAWQVVFITINASWSARLVRERSGIRFSDEERELYQTVFRAFAPVEFMKLLRLARWSRAEPGTLLAAAGRPVPDLMLVHNNAVAVDLAEGGTRTLRDGAFVGELSFVRGGAASATVRVVEPTRYLAWSKPALVALLERNPALRTALQTVISEDLTKKLLESR
ncbi:MAG: cyclic nucleotide-binding domain-containing protein [Alphaproteobacteria bacterium]|nr:cyclic nucleotide-binding domain-containing protein [Alphaproteobacteria bacterium]